MKRHLGWDRKKKTQGVALLFAIGLLTLFGLLGAAWFQAGQVALARRQVMELRARAMAAALGGADTASARLESARQEGVPDKVAGEWAIPLRGYGMTLERNGSRDPAGERPDVQAEARVSVRMVDAAAMPGAPSDATACYVVRAEGAAWRLVLGRPYDRARWTVERGYALTQSGLRLVYTVSGVGDASSARTAEAKEHGNG